MKNNKIRILQSVNIMNRAGLETMLMNYYRNIDRNKIQFDFLTHRPEKGDYDDEIESMGGKVYHAPRLLPHNFLKYKRFMKDFYKAHPEYKIIHSHIDTMSYFPLKEAKKNKIPIRIAHSHTSKLDKDIKFIIKYWAKLNIKKVANVFCGCGKKACKFLFKNDDATLINNAIDTEKFKFDENIRNAKRKELGIDNNTFVIGHVGRFVYIKNQLFLVEIFRDFLKYNSNSKLLLIGSGPDEKKIIKKINKYKLNDKVILLKNRNDVNELYQVMDFFVMPSLFEGLPLVAIEAQCNGLNSILSDRISKEVLITKNIKMRKLISPSPEWAADIFITGNTRNKESVKEIVEHGYDIRNESKKLEDFYIRLNNKVIKNENSNDRAKENI